MRNYEKNEANASKRMNPAAVLNTTRRGSSNAVFKKEDR